MNRGSVRIATAVEKPVGERISTVDPLDRFYVGFIIVGGSIIGAAWLAHKWAGQELMTACLHAGNTVEYCEQAIEKLEAGK